MGECGGGGWEGGVKDSRTCSGGGQNSLGEDMTALLASIEQGASGRMAGAGMVSACREVGSRPGGHWPAARPRVDKASAPKKNTRRRQLTYGCVQESRWYSGMRRVDVDVL